MIAELGAAAGQAASLPSTCDRAPPIHRPSHCCQRRRWPSRSRWRSRPRAWPTASPIASPFFAPRRVSAGASGVPADLAADAPPRAGGRVERRRVLRELVFVRARPGRRGPPANRRSRAWKRPSRRLRSGDRDLGARRPQSVEALLAELAAVLESTRTHRAALDHYAMVRGSLLQYERTVRPVMSGLDGAHAHLHRPA